MTRTRLLPRGLLALCAAAALTGCVNMSGLAGSSSYACKAPEGVACDSVSGTYANAIHNNLPSQRPRVAPAPSSASASAFVAVSAAPTAAQGPAAAPSIVRADDSPRVAPSALSPAPLRSSARILRLWFKPWEDADHDLYDQGYVYVQADAGQWLVDHAQRQIRDAYAPIRPAQPLRPPAHNTSASGDAGDRAALPPNLKSTPRLPAADSSRPGLAGLVPAPVPPETSD